MSAWGSRARVIVVLLRSDGDFCFLVCVCVFFFPTGGC